MNTVWNLIVTYLSEAVWFSNGSLVCFVCGVIHHSKLPAFKHNHILKLRKCEGHTQNIIETEKINKKQEAHMPHRSPEKTVQINKHIHGWSGLGILQIGPLSLQKKDNGLSLTMLWYVIIALRKFVYWFEFVSQVSDVAQGPLDCLLVYNRQST